MPPSKDSYRVRKPAQLRALATPQRQELVATLQALQPCTVRELAVHLGRKPVSLYYHVRKLEEVGLVRTDGERAGETLYRLPADEVRLDPEQRTGASLAALRKLGASILRHAQRLYDEAVPAPQPAQVRRRRHTLAQKTFRLRRGGLERINDEIRELLELIDAEKADAGEEFFTLTLHLAPNPGRGETGRER